MFPDSLFYLDPQLTSWTTGAAGANYSFPKNELVRYLTSLHVVFLIGHLNEQLNNGC